MRKDSSNWLASSAACKAAAIFSSLQKSVWFWLNCYHCHPYFAKFLRPGVLATSTSLYMPRHGALGYSSTDRRSENERPRHLQDRPLPDPTPAPDHSSLSRL